MQRETVCRSWEVAVLGERLAVERLDDELADARERRAQPEADFRVYSNLAQMCLLGIALSLLFGASLYNGVRYNWLWIAAFAGLALQFCRQTVVELEEEEMVAEGGESP